MGRAPAPSPAPDVVRVDLGDGSVAREPIPERRRRRFLGGKGLAARYLYDDVGPGVDPLAPGNALLFALGPLSGLVPGEPRVAVVTKSPLTGAFLDSYCGGTVAARLPGALGATVLSITGRAPEPTALVLDAGEVRLRSATDLWGADARATDEAFPDAAVACVGPAGENRVRYATIAADGGDHHAGRGGAGAVMGAKRLKALVVRGPPPDERLADAPAAVRELRARTRRRFAESETGRWLGASGTMETIDAADEAGVLPTRGWRRGSFEGASDLGIDAVREASAGRERPADSTPGDFRVAGRDGEVVPRGGTPIALGAGLGIGEFDAVVELGERCDRLGLDVIGAGNAVGWALRAAEEGSLDPALLDGVADGATFGDPETARALIDAVATREGRLGDALADGVAAAADRLGAADLAPTIKGMSLASYDPRGSPAMALAFATSDRGACHRRARPVFREAVDGRGWSDAERVATVRAEQDRRSVRWSLVVDDFVGEVLDDDLVAAWLAAVGVDPDGDLRTVGERVWTLTRLVNVREGFDRADDSLPALLTDGREDGTGRGLDGEAFDRLLSAYYAARGWSEDGMPTASLLDRLGLGSVVDAATPVARDRPARDG
ncbi:aldehyde ferredoxin oxidoreductase family protein [Salinilacihabitans rarus]|uniref:aldehyde ferredoxin oxidoreductase family protein n=1 Tax=Salinilacihabitans rarus TaxID=2961596 RepID=UPI0020C8A8D5|nr:aldehyde ferredoxin oxidoreductase C-terminal domain-containing protein [Salinilacihabitans rarus]